ncbi:MAG: bifunctional 23S rRNA (guanine(2069)-N(7))-methyltransferase RlmK/23S rRNA (guanine(2445)-N(2))-methyltransferase RlmL [Spirochaetaceae bacterium]|nr:bifunctional 23S rRNA (guanine(2069)-N(7))-methyltransferase RlmK/23S rRNA (guanine(2445)-N(2))-methyltransferase RlmL [Spirochaetaceae bacterium]MCF7948198.1 bifunctional 23S rRNA (guanine(2069)-N(7))-methyltransferase RlmK/23S rRNA (guanine(2445)-N(2))-methyltransferase RlmL [Spirochaetia bacterium]MCF7950814.1 bifunctional 23S rRNA (guanine(2069)-N(7))-methyltransferase RlmK/23S rRNA (guanine(2445)-N(2))-methyltransferase RlmL [Spirochaetaceae bacterium]
MYRLFVTCTRYLEPLLKDELEVLGASDIKQTVAGCHASGDLRTAYQLCLWSRVGSRVLLKLHEFEFSHEDDIYTGAAEVSWEGLFSLSSTFAVDANVSKSRVKNANYAALKVKDAVVDSFRKSSGRRPNVNTENPDIRFHLHTEKQSAIVYLDLSGESLHRRGYRLSGTQAPLRETSAAGMLLKAGWPEIAAQGGALIDPLCGSGTLPIEAALIAGNIAPGLLRSRFGFESWKGHEADTWDAVRTEAETARAQGVSQMPPIYGSDKSRKAIDAAAENIKRAGLSDKIQLKTQPFEHLEVPLQAAAPGLIVANPPYGVRLQKREEVDLLYSQFGKWIKEHFPNYTAAILAPDKAAAKQLGLRADRINTIYNGNLKIVLVRITLDDANSFVPPENSFNSPAFIQGAPPVQDEDQTSGVNMLVNRILKNKRQLKKYLKKNGISSYRIYDADIPQYAAAVDVYEDRYAVVQEYAPPKEIEPEAAEQRLQELLAAIPQCFEIDKSSIFLKQRKRQKGSSQYSKMNTEHEFFIVKEGGLKFYVNFTDYLDTGLFLDHRITRSIIREKSDQSKFLNLFAYTCTASVYAADGGAVKTVSVDTSNTYLEWGKKNFALNRYTSDSHLFVRRDVFEFLSSDFETYDLIFVDPPTFSNRKSDENVFDVQRDHLRMLTLAAEHLKRTGEIIFSNNYRRFQLDPALYDLFDIKEISLDTLPQDFSRNKKIHRTWLLRFPG